MKCRAHLVDRGSDASRCTHGLGDMCAIMLCKGGGEGGGAKTAGSLCNWSENEIFLLDAPKNPPSSAKTAMLSRQCGKAGD